GGSSSSITGTASSTPSSNSVSGCRRVASNTPRTSSTASRTPPPRSGVCSRARTRASSSSRSRNERVNTVKRIGVLGAGVMGSGIAQVTATAGYETVCYDVDAGALETGREHVTTGRYGLERGVERGKVTREQADAALARLTFTSTFEDAAAVDLVVEAVPERLELKVRVFRELDRAAPDGTILASNTSGFAIAGLAAATDRADRVLGWHWASPAPATPLAEIVSTRDTSDETLAAVKDVANACGKNPVVIRDTPMAWGFVTNRVYFAMVAEAQKVVSEGIASAEDVDQLMMDCFRWPTGPFGMVQGASSGWG